MLLKFCNYGPVPLNVIVPNSAALAELQTLWSLNHLMYLSAVSQDILMQFDALGFVCEGVVVCVAVIDGSPKRNS